MTAHGPNLIRHDGQVHFHSGSDDESAAAFEDWNRRMSAPENEAPAGLPFSVVLGRTDQTAVFLTAFQVYSTGLAFTLSIRLRSEPRGHLGHRIHELVSGHGHVEPDVALDDRLLLGVEFADGRTATNLPMPWRPPFGEDAGPRDAPTLNMSGGSGGSRSYDQDLWLSPLPPAGPVIVVCRWPGFGIAESQTALDGAAIVAALESVQTLWPWEPAVEPDLEPSEPQLPADGWFASALRRPPTR
jgi:hypothetical protein